MLSRRADVVKGCKRQIQPETKANSGRRRIVGGGGEKISKARRAGGRKPTGAAREPKPKLPKVVRTTEGHGDPQGGETQKVLATQDPA